jgi:glycosyltransferase involved in cell wall biosynthesis
VRVAIVGTELCALDEAGGGLEHVVLRWGEALSAEHDVVIVSYAPGGRPPRPPNDAIVLERPADLGAALRRIGPDLVSLHNRPEWARLVPPGSAAAVTFHNFPRAWKVRARSWAATRARAGAPGVVCAAVSATLAVTAASALGLPAGRVAVTPPSIDPAFIDPPPRAPGPVVLSPNRLLRKKGVLDLLAVAQRPVLRDVEFLFADLLSPWLAPTAEHVALRAAVARVPNAHLFAPASSARALAERYATSGVVACPAREPEGLGLVPLEAQACRAPVVTTDAGGLRDATFPPNRCIPPSDLDALAEALVRALRASDDGERARRAVIDQHSPNAAGAHFLRWVAEAVP